MKCLSNKSDKLLVYKEIIIPPKGSILLDSNGKVIDDITDNKEEIKKADKSIRDDLTKQLKDLDEKIDNLDKHMIRVEFDKDKKILNIIKGE